MEVLVKNALQARRALPVFAKLCMKASACFQYPRPCNLPAFRNPNGNQNHPDPLSGIGTRTVPFCYMALTCSDKSLSNRTFLRRDLEPTTPFDGHNAAALNKPVPIGMLLFLHLQGFSWTLETTK